MLKNSNKKQVIFCLCLLLFIDGLSALARIDNNWSNYRRPNITVGHSQGLQSGYRPAVQIPSYNSPQQGSQYNNRTQSGQPIFKPNPPQGNAYAFNQSRPSWQQPSVYPSSRPSSVNQTRPSWPQSGAPQYPAYGQQINQTRPNGLFNQTRPSWQQPAAGNYPQYPSAKPGSLNQTRPTWPQPSAPQPPNYPQYSPYGQQINQTRSSWQQPAAGNYPQYPSTNQTRPLWPQPGIPQTSNYPQYPSYGPQASQNQSRPSWPQPSAPQIPNYPQYPAYGQQNNQTRPQTFNPSPPVYPVLPNSSNYKPPVATNSWTPAANQTLLYPQLPNQNYPQPPPPAVTNTGGIPLAPLQPLQLQNPQGPHNWHSGGQAVLSYGPGYYPSEAEGANKKPPPRQGSSNPYANIFN